MNKNKKYFILFFFFFFSFLLLLPAVYTYAQESSGTGEYLIGRMAVMVIQLSVIIFIAWAGGSLFRKFDMPRVLGEIIAGVLIGPYLLGSVPLPGFENGLFDLRGNFPITRELYGFTTVASIVLLFLVGLETNIETFFSFSAAGSAVGIGGVIVSFIFGDWVGVILSRYLFGQSVTFTDPVPLFMGIIATATSVGITARILSDKRKMDSPEGVTILAGAVIDDVLGIIILAIVVGIIKSGHVEWKGVLFIALRAFALWFGFTTLGIVFSQQLSRLLKKFNDNTTIAVMSLALALLLGGIFEKSGLAMIIGAYIMGLSLSKTDLSYIIQDNMVILQKFLVPVFFCVMGMLVNVKVILSFPILMLGIIYFVAAVFGKIIGCSIPALFLDFNWLGALRIGVGMVPRGEVALIMAGIGLSLGILQQEAYGVAIVMTFFTTLITPPFLSKLFDKEGSVLRKNHVLRREHKQIVYNMPNPETSAFILTKVIEAFEQEGFYVHFMGIPERLYQIRKNETFITLKYKSRKFIFDCFAEDVSFIHTLFYEVLAELEHIMRSLQTLTDKNLIGKKIFDTKVKATNEKSAKVSHVLSPLAVEVNLKGNTKREIIEELIEILVKSGQLEQSQKPTALKDLWEREIDMSTGMQDEIALPHARTNAVNTVICAVGLKKSGIDFESMDKKPSRIFVVIFAPKEKHETYLQFVAEMTKMLMSEENRNRILSCETSEELYKAFAASA